MNIKYPNIKVPLSDIDGNAFIILGTCLRAAKAGGLSKSAIKDFLLEAQNSDYQNLLSTCTKWFDCE